MRPMTPDRAAALQATFSPRDMAIAATLPLWLLVPGHALQWMLTGELARGGAWGLLAWLGALPWLWLMRRCAQAYAGTPAPPRPPALFWPYAAAIYGWILFSSWFFPPQYGALPVLVTGAMLVNTIRMLHDAAPLRQSYVAGGLGAWGALLLVDLVGGPGPLHLAGEAPLLVVGTLLGHVLVVAATVAGVRAIGRQFREGEDDQRDRAELERQIAVMAREREVVQRSSTLMVQGLAATQFSHDVKSPLTVLALHTWELGELLPTLPPAQATALARIRDELTTVQETLGAMAAELVRAVSGPSQAAPQPVDRLADEACRVLQQLLPGYRLAAPRLALPAPLPSTPVWTAPGHATVLANILLNSRLHGSEDIELTVQDDHPHFLRLCVRDFGVAAADRAPALARVRQRLALEAPVPAPASAEPAPGALPQSYGLGLMLAKLQLMRAGGTLRAEAPAQGPGLRFVLVLPRRDPASLPPGARPEQA